MYLELVSVSKWKKTMSMRCKPFQLSIIEICPDRPVELERQTLPLYMWVEWEKSSYFFFPAQPLPVWCFFFHLSAPNLMILGTVVLVNGTSRWNIWWWHFGVQDSICVLAVDTRLGLVCCKTRLTWDLNTWGLCLRLKGKKLRSLDFVTLEYVWILDAIASFGALPICHE